MSESPENRVPSPDVPVAEKVVQHGGDAARHARLDAVRLEADLVYTTRDGEPLTLDLFLPPSAPPGRSPAPRAVRAPGGAPLPVVVLVGGFPGAGVRRIFGRPFPKMGPVASWCRLLAASGLAAVAFENRAPVEDLARCLDWLRAHGAEHGLDATRVALWSSSGNAPTALAGLLGRAGVDRTGVVCGALLYPYTLDLDGATAVADAAAQWRFAPATAGATLDEFSPGIPVLLVRAGADAFAGLNESVDRLVAAAMRRDLPVTCLNHAGAAHAFDLDDASPRTAAVIDQVLAFLRAHLAVRPAAEAAPAPGAGE